MKNIPNILTILRLLACPLLIYLFEAKYFLWVLIIFILACLTDFFDGYLARKGNYKTNFGKFLDPIADKALILTMCVLLIINLNFGIHIIPFYIIIIREIIFSFLRFNLSRWNKNKIIDVSLLSKYKIFLQMLAIGGVLSNTIFFHIWKIYNLDVTPDMYKYFVFFLIWISAFVTIITGVQHFKTYLKLKK